MKNHNRTAVFDYAKLGLALVAGITADILCTKLVSHEVLDAAVLRAFIDRIEVSHVNKKSRTREITIVYNFIGAFDFTRAIENTRNTSKKEQRTA